VNSFLSEGCERREERGRRGRKSLGSVTIRSLISAVSQEKGRGEGGGGKKGRGRKKRDYAYAVLHTRPLWGKKRGGVKGEGIDYGVRGCCCAALIARLRGKRGGKRRKKRKGGRSRTSQFAFGQYPLRQIRTAADPRTEGKKKKKKRKKREKRREVSGWGSFSDIFSSSSYPTSDEGEKKRREKIRGRGKRYLHRRELTLPFVLAGTMVEEGKKKEKKEKKARNRTCQLATQREANGQSRKRKKKAEARGTNYFSGALAAAVALDQEKKRGEKKGRRMPRISSWPFILLDTDSEEPKGKKKKKERATR